MQFQVSGYRCHFLCASIHSRIMRGVTDYTLYSQIYPADIYSSPTTM